MVEVRRTDVFVAWFEGLKDRAAQARITALIRRLSLGTQATLSRSGKAFQKCGSTMARATGCISSSAAKR